MGLIDRERKDYWHVRAGALCRTTTEDDPAARRREYTTKTGEENVIFEEVKAGIDGFITGVEIVAGKFGDQLYVNIRDVEEFVLQMPWKSTYAKTFLERLPGADVKQMVTIMPYSFEDKAGKKRSGITLFQNDVKVDSLFRRWDGEKTVYKNDYPHCENPNDKDEWDIVNIKQFRFLKENVVDKFPFIDEGVNEGAVKGVNEGASQKRMPEPKDQDFEPIDKSDDLPF
jgi:hypothetical protein